jgi:hypothetical protein
LGSLRALKTLKREGDFSICQWVKEAFPWKEIFARFNNFKNKKFRLKSEG